MLESALERPTYGLNRLAEQRQFDFDEITRRLAGFRDPTGVLSAQGYLRTDLTPEERFYLQRLSDNVQRSVTAAMSTLRSFAMPPGRKVMLPPTKAMAVPIRKKLSCVFLDPLARKKAIKTIAKA